MSTFFSEVSIHIPHDLVNVLNKTCVPGLSEKLYIWDVVPLQTTAYKHIIVTSSIREGTVLIRVWRDKSYSVPEYSGIIPLCEGPYSTFTLRPFDSCEMALSQETQCAIKAHLKHKVRYQIYRGLFESELVPI